MILLYLSILIPVIAENLNGPDRDFRDWSLEEAVGLLTRSPWAQQQTFTRVVGGVGSGVMGEKEIYSTFFVRFLSARPIREAFTRINQIRHGYDDLGPNERQHFDRLTASTLELDVEHWIVVTVTFRSNDLNLENRVSQFLQTQTEGTLRNRAFLSTTRAGRVPLAAYFPPLEEEVGAKFVFPRYFGGGPVVTPDDPNVAFELDVPGANPELRTVFQVSDMIVNGELQL